MRPEENRSTFFASPERSSEEELAREIGLVSENPLMDTLMASVGGLLAVLDKNRQILTVNETLLKKLNLENLDDLRGLRPGEALHCSFSDDGPGGCGTGRYCSTCGAAIAITSCLATNKTVERRCIITCNDGRDLVFQVRAHPVDLEGYRFIMLFLMDITKWEQRAVLERTFFHDINNLLQGLSSASELLLTYQDESLTELVRETSLRLINEVGIQRYLLEGEFPCVQVRKGPHILGEILKELENQFRHNPLVKGKKVEYLCRDRGRVIETDSSLLLRILNNMVSNALEASSDGETVRVRCRPTGEGCTFEVENSQFIEPTVANRIFQRNFSTKEGTGRGLGTFSMKLLGEKMLGGRVSFTSSPEGGTVFSLCL